VTTKTQSGQTIYQYNAGNWKTALLAGAGFEFGKGSTRQFTVSINYFKGIGNLDEQTISSVSGGKPVTTTLESSVSGWNMKVGIPFTLWTKRPAIKNTTQKRQSINPVANNTGSDTDVSKLSERILVKYYSLIQRDFSKVPLLFYYILRLIFIIIRR
jgi:hypothetical protein